MDMVVSGRVTKSPKNSEIIGSASKIRKDQQTRAHTHTHTHIYIYTLGAGGSPGTPAPRVFIYMKLLHG